MDKPRYTSIFASLVKPIVSEAKDKYLALASLGNLKQFLPDINVADNIDLLPFACSATVVNRVNKNNDVIDTDTGLRIYKWFQNKPVNIEHDRKAIVGCIIKASLSEFGTEKPLTEEEVKGTNKPFNITLGGVVWRVINKRLAELLEETNDPDSDEYMSVSASWECGFSEYVIVGLEDGKKNLEDKKLLITDEKEVEEAKKNLKAFGGTGKLNGLSIYRQPTYDALPLGIGLTESPAADVKGVAVETMDTVINITDTKATVTAKSTEKNNTESFAQTENDCVRITTDMKLKSIKDINDTNWKELTASTVAEFITEEIKAVNATFEVEKLAKETAIKQAEESRAKIEADLKKSNETLTQVQAALDKIQKENTERETLEKFNQRMSAMDEGFELSKEDREIISASIKGLDDAGFEGFKKNMGILMKEKNKSYREAQAKIAADKSKTVVVASTVAEVVEGAVDGAKKDPAVIPATSTPEPETMFQKYKNAFSEDQFEISV